MPLKVERQRKILLELKEKNVNWVVVFARDDFWEARDVPYFSDDIPLIWNHLLQEFERFDEFKALHGVYLFHRK